MKTSLTILLFTILTILSPYEAFSQKPHKMLSPNKKIALFLEKKTDGNFGYRVEMNDKELIAVSEIGYKLKNGEQIPLSKWNIKDIYKRKVDNVWNPIWGKRAIVPDRFNEFIFTISSETRDMIFAARLYDDAVAFRYEIQSSSKEKTETVAELTEFNFAGDYTAWFYNGENHNIGPEKLSDSNGNRKPVMSIEVDKSQYMAIHEAYLQAGTPLALNSIKGSVSFTIPPANRIFSEGEQSAWRVILLGETIGELVDSHVIELLNPQPTVDFSWVKPGVAVWDWRIDGAQIDGFTYSMTYPSWVRMVDFAAEQGFSYLVLDANWYGPEHESSSDPVKGDKASDVQRILKYAKEKGIGVWLYLNDVGGRKYPIEQTLKQYSDWGAAGIKYGFMSGTLAEKNIWTQKITALCAENHLLVDFHDGPVHPYGQMRTWPNALTREYCHAQLDAHRVFTPKTFVTSVFINMIAGPIDMNNGMFDLRQGNTTRVDESQPVPSTLVSEAARTLIVFSGATILPDIPEYYRKYPDLLRFISSQKMPWVESKTLDGKIGEYIVMMRQTKEAYLIGAATNEQPRIIDVSLSFLPKGTYKLLLIQDGDDAHYINNRETLKIETINVKSSDKISIDMKAGGGACMILERIDEK